MAVGLDVLQLAVLAAVALAGAFIQSAFGFGFAILAAPIFLATIGTGAAIQVLVVLHVVLSAIVVPAIRRDIPGPLLAWLAGGSLVGFPLGLALFMAADARTLQLSVGIATIAFSLLLAQRELSTAPEPALSAAGDGSFRPASALGIGLGAGALTSILVMPGPPAMLYFRALRLAKAPSRGVALSFFGFCYVMATALHALVAGMQASTWITALILAPFVLAGSLAGNRAARHLSEERFRMIVLALLITSGIYAVVAAVR